MRTLAVGSLNLVSGQFLEVVLHFSSNRSSCSRNQNSRIGNMTWHVAGPSEYLVITGLFVKDVKISKKAWVVFGQRWSRIDIKPVTYKFDVRAMSLEKLQFILPASYTIGPYAEDTDALRKYAKLVSAHEHLSPHVNNTVKSIVEGETRVLAAGMAMEEIFNGSEEFKRKVKEGVQRELQKLGLHVYNANVMQLEDVEGHEYFLYLGKKAQKEAENQAKVDVAKAQNVGDTGTKAMEARTRQSYATVEAETGKYTAEQKSGMEQRIAELEAETTRMVNKQAAEKRKADNELEMKTVMWEKEVALAKIEAQKATELKETEMRAEVERKKVQAEEQKLRAEVVVQSTIKEASQEKAKAELFKRERAAEADAFAAKQAADARLFGKVKEAEALRTHAAAIAYYVRVLSWALLQGLALLLLLMHVNSWLAATKMAVPSPDGSTSSDVALRLPSFIFTPINNAIFHYFLPSAPMSPHLSLTGGLHPSYDNLHKDDNISNDNLIVDAHPPYDNLHKDDNISNDNLTMDPPSTLTHSPTIIADNANMPPHMEQPPLTTSQDHKPLE